MLPKSVYKKATVITRTPMRITLGGGGTDVIWYSRLRGGSWLSAAIDKYIYVALTPIKSAVRNQDDRNKIIRECLRLLNIKDKFNINIFSDVPPQSGLGGSGALEVGLLSALHVYRGDKIIPQTLAREAADIEILRLKMAVGPQDQYIAALGGIKSFEINKKSELTARILNLSAKTKDRLHQNLIFFSTGIAKNTQKVLSAQKKQRQNLEMLDRIKNLGLAAKKYLLTGKTDEFGTTLHIHWLMKKELSRRVSSPQIDQWYNKALSLGSLGGKIMGAGGGGWFMFYVNKNQTDFIKSMQKSGLKHERINFDWEGTKVLKYE